MVIAALALLVVLAGLVIVRTAAPTVRTVAAATVTDADGLPHQPWYGLHLLHQQIRFHERSGPLPGQPPAINAAAGILVDIDTGEILWERNPHQALPPASTTKVMTALLVLENYAPDHLLTVTPDALGQQWDETKMGLRAGEKLTVQELLTGMMLVSANDAASALADDTVGWDRFIGAMNAQEAALGLHDSHFATPVGLDTPGHLISAYDEAAIADAAVQNFPLFREIVDTGYTTLPASADHQAYQLYNIDELLSLYPAAVGIKPGYTGDAGPCLVGMAVRDGHRLISVLMNAPYDYHQSRTLLDWGFTVEGLSAQFPTPAPHPSPTP